MTPGIADLLTDAEIRFAQMLSQTGNRAEAAKYANPAEKSPERAALRYLGNPNVEAYLTFLHQESQSRGGQPLADHLFDLSAIRASGENMIADLIRRAGPGDASAAASMFASTLRATELRGRASNLYVERREVSGPNGGPVPGSFKVDWE